MSQLNPRQQEAMQYVSGPLLVLAGAGSGKTSVITRKIAYLIEECQMPAERITAVTFTNKAAQEMRSRIESLFNMSAAGLWIGTFHGLAHRDHIVTRSGTGLHLSIAVYHGIRKKKAK